MSLFGIIEGGLHIGANLGQGVIKATAVFDSRDGAVTRLVWEKTQQITPVWMSNSTI
jgi:hypothetical protein